MKRFTDVVIVGGGIIGCAISYFLSKRGLRVIVFEKAEIGAQSSSAAAGLLAPIRPLDQREDPFKALLLAGIARFPSCVPQLEADSGISVTYEPTGTLRLLPPTKVVPTQAWADDWRQAGYQIELLTPEQACEREPLLSPEFAGAVHIADEAQVSPIQLVKAYVQAARQAGVVFYEHTEVVAFKQSDTHKRIEGIWTKQGDLFACQHLIIAAGVWSATVGSWLGVPFPIRPVRGEIVALQQPSIPVQHIIFDEGIYDQDVYIAPKSDGTVLIGATKAEVGFDLSVSAGGVQHLLDVAIQLLPELAHCPIHRMWAGLRPKSLNSRPLLGPVPSWQNVTIASGHGGFGVTLSLITGETIAEFVATGTISDLLHPFVPI